MTLLKHIRLMARYNQWMNEKLYASAAELSTEQLEQDRRAFFSSILGTLNHLMIGDIIWLKRLSEHPQQHLTLNGLRRRELPGTLDAPLYPSLLQMREARVELDETILTWCAELTEADLDHDLRFTSMNGQSSQKHFGSLLLHLFNHQTHHRGQVTTMLSQEGLDVGVTDLLVLIPNAESLTV